jgi:hypothetical protein
MRLPLLGVPAPVPPTAAPPLALHIPGTVPSLPAVMHVPAPVLSVPVATHIPPTIPSLPVAGVASPSRSAPQPGALHSPGAAPAVPPAAVQSPTHPTTRRGKAACAAETPVSAPPVSPLAQEHTPMPSPAPGLGAVHAPAPGPAHAPSPGAVHARPVPAVSMMPPLPQASPAAPLPHLSPASVAPGPGRSPAMHQNDGVHEAEDVMDDQHDDQGGIENMMDDQDSEQCERQAPAAVAPRGGSVGARTSCLADALSCGDPAEVRALAEDILRKKVTAARSNTPDVPRHPAAPLNTLEWIQWAHGARDALRGPGAPPAAMANWGAAGILPLPRRQVADPTSGAFLDAFWGGNYSSRSRSFWGAIIVKETIIVIVTEIVITHYQSGD